MSLPVSHRLQPGVVALLPGGFSDDRLTRAWLASALFMLAVMVVTLPAWFVDPRMVDGVHVWTKPLKFALSLSLHFFTLALLAQPLLRRSPPGWPLTIAGYAAVLAMLFEQVYIMFQAARGRRSHFNFDTEIESLLYAAMGIFAVLLVLAPFVLGLVLWRRGEKDGSGFRLGAILGLLLGSVLTLLFGGYLSSNGSHWIGATAGDATGLPLLGWSREAGDLRAPHFFATHMMQTLPLVGLLFDRLAWNPRVVVWIAAVGQTAAVLGLFALALAGRPLLPL